MKNISKKSGTEKFRNVKCTAFFTRPFQNKLNILDYSTLFVLLCHVLTDMVRVIEGKII